MKKAERFSIYRHSFVYGNNLIVTKQFIVLNHADGTRTFTDFHRYVENPNKKVKKFNEDGNNRFIFINKFLNYAFFTIGISSLSDLTVDIGRNFLNAYGMHELPDDDEYVHRGKGTVEKCIKAVLDFYINLTNDKSSGCKIKSADLYRYITVRDKYGKAIKKMIPQFDLWIHCNCQNCGSVYGAEIKDMISGDANCPYCKGMKVLAGFNSLKVKNPELAKQISPLNKVDADHVLPSKHSVQLWRCPDCGGDYAATTLDMENGYTCPYCNDRLLLKGFNSFGDKHPDLLEEMDEIANYLLPYTEFDVLDASDKKFWWTCPKNPKHKYSMSPKTRLLFQKRNREPCLYCRGQRRKLNHFIDYKSNK